MTSHTSDNIIQIREELQNREAEIDLLQQSLIDIFSELDLDKVYSRVAEKARELIQAETVLISILNEKCSHYTYYGAAGLNADEILGESLPIDYGVCGWVWKHKKPWWKGTLKELSSIESMRWKNEINNIIMTPLVGKKHFQGGISGIKKINGEAFNQRDLNLLSMFSSIVIVSIENAMAVKELEQAKIATENYQLQLEHSNRLLTESNHELEVLSLYDQITGLPNRSLFYDRLNQHITTCQSHNETYCIGILLLDLNNFKDINESFGHDSGDLLLRKVAMRLMALLGAEETISRLGGDEFAIILPMHNQSQCIEKSQQLLNSLKKAFVINNTDVVTQGSIGISLFPEHGNNNNDLLKHADLAMYTAKRNKQGTHVYDPKIDIASIKSITILTDLHTAVTDKEFTIFYQAKINIQQQRTTSVEALGRWIQPSKGNIPPNVFIPALEQAGLIDEYTYEVIGLALLQIKQWQAQSIDIKIAINISTQTLNNPEFIEHIENIISDKKYGQQLIFEITENLFLSEYDKLSETLKKLRSLGISLSIDDYGTGFSSLSRLKKLPVSELKIDQSFIKDMKDDKDDKVIVLSTIELAHNLGLSVVAEGVEDIETFECLRALNCDIIQGYLIGRPVPIEELEIFLSDEKTNLKNLFK